MGDTIVAVATAWAPAAIGVLRLSGPEALSIALRYFRPKRGPHAVPKPRYAHFGEIWIRGQLLDQVVLTYFPKPHSYTGEEVVEISFHGSLYILQSALEAFQEAGARLARPGEFTLRAYLNRKLSLDQAEAVASLIQAQSEAAHRLALSQLRGAYYQKVRALRQNLIDYLALLELELDFSEEDVEFASRSQLLSLLRSLKAELEHLLSSYRMGQAIREGIPLAIVGAPNVGKSTLLNALLGEARAIVSDIPGTTRDTLQERLFIEGYELRLIDTAGLRKNPNDPIEEEGMKRTRMAVREAFLTLIVVEAPHYDSLEAIISHATCLLGQLPDRYLLMANKVDLLPPEHPLWKVETLLKISARQGTGLEALKKRMAEELVLSGANSELLLSHFRHYAAFTEAMQAVEEAKALLAEGQETALIAQALRGASWAIGSITGEITAEDVLGSVFARFCIGK
jgi:tRNA modification GTPase